MSHRYMPNRHTCGHGGGGRACVFFILRPNKYYTFERAQTPGTEISFGARIRMYKKWHRARQTLEFESTEQYSIMYKVRDCYFF